MIKINLFSNRGTLFVIYYIISKIRNIVFCAIRKIVGERNFYRRKYYGIHIGDISEGNDIIYRAIESDKPFLAARFGDAELRTLVYSIECSLGIRDKFPNYIKTVMHRNAGFFPADDTNLYEFGKVLFESSKNVDLFGVWYNLLEDFVIHASNPFAKLVKLEALEPYRSNAPWSRALKGKRVLVVHPFESSIRKQYAVRDKLFSNKNVLPQFDLITYKAFQTIAGSSVNYRNWFEVLDLMIYEISKIQFDIAIVGCGSYGLPLASRIKSLNKKVIHLGGATQLLFGIRGKRWDVRPEMQYLFNEFWIRPDSSERPRCANNVEDACYW